MVSAVEIPMARHLQVFILGVFMLLVGSCIRDNDAHSFKGEIHSSRTALPLIDSIQIDRTLAKLKIASRYHNSVHDAYQRNEGATIWINNGGYNQHARLAAAFFWRFLSVNLLNANRFLPGMRQVFDGCMISDTAKLESHDPVESDILFTCQSLMFLTDLSEGRKSLLAGQPEWYIPVRKFHADSILKSTTLPDAILMNSPIHKQYLALSEKLIMLIKLEKGRGLNHITFNGRNLLPNDSSQTIAQIKKWMNAFGVFDGDLNSSRFDPQFESAVRTARKNLGLRDTALVDNELISQLNVPLSKRIRSVRINLERWKWLPPDSSSSFVRVNIPDFSLDVIEKGVPIKTMRVIVGTESKHTVMFSDFIEHVVFSPYWNVPSSILNKELWPLIRKDHHYLEKNDMEIVGNNGVIDPRRIAWHHYTGRTFPYRIRQKPGAKNALGLVKFSFPNPYGIYMHDTPSKDLFRAQKRAFSHGCIRIAEPKWMAQYLLRDKTEWTNSAIDSAMHAGVESFVKLDHPVPVYITYFTSWVNEFGMLQFREDLYGHDASMEQIMFSTKK